jgi:uncharacterized protein YprB with RNaseH-like and TPR domain
MDGSYMTTPQGSVFVTETIYPIGEPCGRGRLQPPENADPLFAYARIPAANQFQAEDWLFIDTETTGLAGGTGTIAFLVGVGRFIAERFRLRQYIISDPGQEPALIAALNAEFSGVKGVVTFNGKSFDMPLLDTRAIMNGNAPHSPGLAHLDLLPIARRLWKHAVENCTLGCLEYRILDVLRSGEDIAGHLIPMMFFEFLRTGDGSFFADVAYHNRIDILSMTALLTTAAEALQSESHDPGVRGTFLLRIGRVEEAIPLLRQSPETRTVLALLFKRLKRVDEAAPIWEELARQGDFTACVELAKYHEHHLRDPQSALRWTERAVTGSMTAKQSAEIERRLRRLIGKVERSLEKSE